MVISMKRKKNILNRRIFKELKGELPKYFAIGIFLTLMIGFISGLYVANGSMEQSLNRFMLSNKLEDGHFELKEKANADLLSKIQSGEKANLKEYYLHKANDEFDKTFEKEFKEQFEAESKRQYEKLLLSQGLNKEKIAQELNLGFEKYKQTDDYAESYKKAYDKAYSEGREKVKQEVDAEYKKVEKKFDLNDADVKAVPVTVHPFFYKNEVEDYNLDGKKDGKIRLYQKTDEINRADVLEGRLPENKNEIAIDRMHADNVGLKVGDRIKVGKKMYTISGLIAYVNYSTLFEKNTEVVFDAITFDIGMVTGEAFQNIVEDTHYSYAWTYKSKPNDKYIEKELSDSFIKVLASQVITDENEIKDYLPAYENQAVQFAPEDIVKDRAWGGLLLSILMLVMAFIIAITTTNTINMEAYQIGTLKALGYTKGELIRHYIAPPIFVTFIATILGNILGYSVFKDAVVSLYYNSYSLPSYKTLWNSEALIKTTLIPLTIMLLVNLIVVSHAMKYSSLDYLRRNFKKDKAKRSIKLPNWKFFSRYRTRIILQNIPNYFMLFIGIVFVSVLLSLAIGLPDSLNYYKSHSSDMMIADYQYILKDYKDDGKIISTNTEKAEKFSLTILSRKDKDHEEDINLYGLADKSSYVKINHLENLKENEVYITKSYQDKFQANVGDTIILNEKYENKSYEFKVIGIYDKSAQLGVFMPIKKSNVLFGKEEGFFSGYLSSQKINDIDENLIYAVITKQDITKMVDQMEHSMGSFVNYFQVLCFPLAFILMFLLTKIIIEKNSNAISMTKILGYTNREISKLYISSTTILVILFTFCAVFIGNTAMSYYWQSMMRQMSGWFEYHISTIGYVKMLLIIFAAYFVVVKLDFRRIKKIPMDEALKNVE